MGILLAYVRIQKFKKYHKKQLNSTRDNVFQSYLKLLYALTSRQLNNKKTLPDRKAFTKNDKIMEVLISKNQVIIKPDAF